MQTGRLNGLIVRCKDDGRLYRDAAAAHGAHRDELLALARRRSSFVAALSGLVRSTGAAPSQHGSILGWLRRALFGLRVAVLGGFHLGDSLQACAEQESRTVDGYKRALASTWAPDVGDTLRAQFEEIQEAHARVRALRGCA
jgi:uncharacterized protein (TIGR02284 family)